MTYSFALEPEAFQAFENEEEQLNQCKSWGLLSEKATKTKEFMYKGHQMQLSCSIVGFVDPITAVISFDNRQRHCIHPAYLKEMQAASFSQRQTAVTEAATPDERADHDADATPIEAVTHAATKTPKPEAEIPLPAKSAKAEKPAKAPKSKKLALPEEKVKMTAVVKEFATVPNHFTEEDDEVVVYEAVTIVEPETEVGLAWSSHSATLKKLALAVGDQLSFEAKIVAKKLTRHPVPYKINNPSKIQKKSE